MDRGMDQDQARVALDQPFLRGLAPMRRPVIHDPEDPITRSVGLLSHHLVHQAAKGLDPRLLLAPTHDESAADIPRREILQGTTALIFMLDAHRSPWPWGQTGMTA